MRAFESDAHDAPEKDSMKWRHVILFVADASSPCWGFIYRPFPALEEDPTLDLVGAYSPRFYHWIQVWY